MTYLEYKATTKKLNDNLNELEAKLKEVSSTKNGELISDEILKSLEYRNAIANFNKAFKMLQIFNKTAPKKYHRQYSKEKRQIMINN